MDLPHGESGACELHMDGFESALLEAPEKDMVPPTECMGVIFTEPMINFRNGFELGCAPSMLFGPTFTGTFGNGDDPASFGLGTNLMVGFRQHAEGAPDSSLKPGSGFSFLFGSPFKNGFSSYTFPWGSPFKNGLPPYCSSGWLGVSAPGS